MLAGQTWPVRRALGLLMGFVLVGTGACGGKSEAGPAKSAAEQAVPVRVVLPEQRSLRETIDLTTTVGADVSVEIFAKATGRCTGVHVAVGDVVVPDAILLTLDEEEGD